MPTSLRLATFNLENLEDKPTEKPALAVRLPYLRQALVRLRADVLCLQEVNGQEPATGPRTLAALATLMAGTPYETFHLTHTKTQTGVPYDVRNLVVLSRFPILQTQQIRSSEGMPLYRKVTAQPPESEAKRVEWERPILAVQLDLGGGRVLHLMNVHLKSKLPSDIPGQQKDQYTWRSASGWAEGYFLSSMKRVGQAIEIRRMIDEIFAGSQDPWIAVCGDFNADLDDVPMMAIRGRVEETGNPELSPSVMVPCEQSIPEPARYSLLHLGRGNMLDHVLVSRALLSWYRGTEIHNEILPDESGAFRDDTQFPESDHAPVVAEFQIP